MLSYQDFCSVENLYEEWLKYRRGKKDRSDVMEFERNLEENLSALSDDLSRDRYRHGSYCEFYVRDPKFRCIHKAAVRDRVAHQALYSALAPVFERCFIYDSYSSRVGKGTRAARERARKFIIASSKNYRREVWVLHGDVAKYFDSVNHNLLLEMIGRKIAGHKNFMSIIRRIISSYQTKPGIGMPLGNLTSQLFANVYLHELDIFVKHILRVKKYTRYNDDFFIVSDNPDYLRECFLAIRRFASARLKLDLPDEKVSCKRLSDGVDVLGEVFYPWGVVPRARLKRRALAAAKRFSSRRGTTSWRSVVSYLGLLKKTRSYFLSEKLRLAATIKN